MINMNIDELKFDEKGLIPAIVVDSITKKVLTENKEIRRVFFQRLHIFLVIGWIILRLKAAKYTDFPAVLLCQRADSIEISRRLFREHSAF